MSFFHNCDISTFDSDNLFEFPTLKRIDFSEAMLTSNYVSFDHLSRYRFSDNISGHFFLNDSQFNSIWSYPKKYIDLFRSLDFLVQPDFSVYFDLPLICQMFNKFRNHWLSCYYSNFGVDVIPLVLPTLQCYFDWYFLGYPQRSVIAFSDIGCKSIPDYILSDTFDALFSRLNPEFVIYFTRSSINIDAPDVEIIKLPYKECI